MVPRFFLPVQTRRRIWWDSNPTGEIYNQLFKNSLLHFGYQDSRKSIHSYVNFLSIIWAWKAHLPAAVWEASHLAPACSPARYSCPSWVPQSCRPPSSSEWAPKVRWSQSRRNISDISAKLPALISQISLIHFQQPPSRHLARLG